MNAQEQYELAWARLTHVLSFFDRVDTKLSVVLGVNVALLGVLTTQMEALKEISALGWVATGMYSVLTAFSFFFLYRGSFPQLDGGEGSLIYFAQIAKRSPAGFIAEFRAQTPEFLLGDVLEQLRNNAAIAADKFRYLCLAYRLMALSLIPWGAALASFELQG
ncbi:Pycsar system effector family protein [Steroidobacter agaridevorans]|uniref:Pycsar system effector family protein n=1 Tax=Steroidobacter agaridevorans TaxID=2695856 RepID=UPI001323BC47|nr:Pycsar system effector family protein [Steroidobacter agaridevorans]GFE87310.1 hypothetical protein GCM10011488_22640 [Steroidobacter agaridevorans]